MVAAALLRAIDRVGFRIVVSGADCVAGITEDLEDHLQFGREASPGDRPHSDSDRVADTVEAVAAKIAQKARLLLGRRQDR